MKLRCATCGRFVREAHAPLCTVYGLFDGRSGQARYHPYAKDEQLPCGPVLEVSA